MTRRPGRRRRKRKGGKVAALLGKSAINYFSDLFIVAMVVAWIVVLIIMVAAAIYATLRLGETSMWSDVGTMAAMPLSAGGAIWMIKNAVQHAISNKQGKIAPVDFPAVDGADFTRERRFINEEIDQS